MDRKLDQRKKSQPNGLFEPYTVMLDGNPVVVRARSLEEAISKAKVKSRPADEKKEEGDAS